MADQPITGLPTKTASGVASTDKMLAIDSAEGYQILVRDVAKYIIENCDVSTLAGAVRTPKAAIDLLNSNSYLLIDGTDLAENTNIDTIFTPGNYGTSSSGRARTMSGLPTTGNVRYAFNLKVENSAFDDPYTRRQTLQYFNDTFKYVRYGTASNNSWNNWVKEPTRAEVDALNSKTSNGASFPFIANEASAADYNDLPVGLVYNQGVGEHCPDSNGYYLVLTFKARSDYENSKCQFAFSFFTSGVVKYRVQTGGTWREWVTL